VAWTSREVYYATRLGRDPVDHGGHRLITHTYPGAVVFGLLAAVACGVSVYAGAVAAGLMIALGVSAVPSLSDLADDRVPGGGLGVFAAGGTGSWWTLTHYPGWWWTVPLAVTCGAVLHREGDWCTKAGVPRRSWPLPRDGRRWDTSRSPLHWTAGDDTETVWVTPALGVIAVASVAWVTGLIPWVIARVAPLIG
jgi:hypothetical protein